MSKQATKLLSSATATGAGNTVLMPSGANGRGRCSYQAIANGSAGAFAATVAVQVSNDGTNWETLGTLTLSGTATTADADSFMADTPWQYVRGYVTAISGTDATATLLMGI